MCAVRMLLMIRITMNDKRRLMDKLNLVIADLMVVKDHIRLLVLRMNNIRLNRKINLIRWSRCRRMLIAEVNKRLMLLVRRKMSMSLYELQLIRYGVKLMRMDHGNRKCELVGRLNVLKMIWNLVNRKLNRNSLINRLLLKIEISIKLKMILIRFNMLLKLNKYGLMFMVMMILMMLYHLVRH